MARISLKEAYDNRDVIAWLVKHEDEIDELMNILKDIDPNGDLTNVVTKTGDQTIDGIKTFIGKIVADCDIIQNGGNYETHAEQVFTTNDYIVMRDGAVSGLGTGQFSGFQVKKYNGADDGRLVIDNAGVARVGDIGDEQPLATRDEAASMTSGALVKWDGVNQKMIAPASNVGDDTHPVKIVNGEAVAIPGPVLTGSLTSGTVAVDGVNASLSNVNEPMKFYRIGNLASVSYSLRIISNTDTQSTYKVVRISAAGACPKGVNVTYPCNAAVCSVDGTSSGSFPFVYVDTNGTLYLFIRGEAMANKIIVGSLTYICTD